MINFYDIWISYELLIHLHFFIFALIKCNCILAQRSNYGLRVSLPTPSANLTCMPIMMKHELIKLSWEQHSLFYILAIRSYVRSFMKWFLYLWLWYWACIALLTEYCLFAFLLISRIFLIEVDGINFYGLGTFTLKGLGYSRLLEEIDINWW